jgi:hypothetical protein
MTDLFDRALPRCERGELPAFFKDFEVFEHDTDKTRREKWNLQCFYLVLLPCSNNPDSEAFRLGKSSCRRCQQAYLRSLNRPEGPWASRG